MREDEDFLGALVFSEDLVDDVRHDQGFATADGQQDELLAFALGSELTATCNAFLLVWAKSWCGGESSPEPSSHQGEEPPSPPSPQHYQCAISSSLPHLPTTFCAQRFSQLHLNINPFSRVSP